MKNLEGIKKVNEHLAECRRCELWSNGTAIPFVGNDIKCVLFGEAPGSEEVKQQQPFVGKSGKYLMSIFSNFGLDRENFLIINSCNCRPIIIDDNNKVKDGKPNEQQLKACQPINTFYILNSGMKHVMTLGNYAKWFFTGEIGGISQDAGKIIIWNDINIMFNFHPASVFYNATHRESFERNIDHFCSLVCRNE
jgi:uracil-DNA glycosylase